MSYSPSLHIALNKAPAVVGSLPSDAKSFYYDTVLKLWRPFQSVNEAIDYFKVYEKNPTFEVYVNTSLLDDSTGTFADPTALKVYWFMDYINLSEKRQEVDLSNYVTNNTLEANYYNREDIDNKISSVFHYKGSVQNYIDLPTTGNVIGDVWNIVNADTANSIKAGDNVAWTGSSWDVLSGYVDLSAYATLAQVNALIATALQSANTYTDEKIAGIDTSFPVWTDSFSFTATQKTGTQFTLTEMPVKFIITLLNGQDISENFDVQVDDNKVLTLNTELVIGWTYSLKLTFTFRQE